MFVFSDGERESIEDAVCAEPDKARLAHPQLRFEHVRVGLADQAVDAIRADNQIVTGKAREIVNLRLKAQVYAEFAAAIREDVEQHPPRHACENMPPTADDLSPIVNVDWIPDHELIGDRLIRFVICFTE